MLKAIKTNVPEKFHYPVLCKRINTEVFEGRRNCVYNDTLGNATVGIGHHLKGSRSIAILKKMGINSRKLKAGEMCLTDSEVDMLFEADYNDAVRDAKKIFPELEDYPPLAQLVIVDLVFNMGYYRLSKFKRAIGAFKEFDYLSAAAHLEDSLWYSQTKTRAYTITKTLREFAYRLDKDGFYD